MFSLCLFLRMWRGATSPDVFFPHLQDSDGIIKYSVYLTHLLVLGAELPIAVLEVELVVDVTVLASSVLSPTIIR